MGHLLSAIAKECYTISSYVRNDSVSLRCSLTLPYEVNIESLFSVSSVSPWTDAPARLDLSYIRDSRITTEREREREERCHFCVSRVYPFSLYFRFFFSFHHYVHFFSFVFFYDSCVRGSRFTRREWEPVIYKCLVPSEPHRSSFLFSWHIKRTRLPKFLFFSLPLSLVIILFVLLLDCTRMCICVYTCKCARTRFIKLLEFLSGLTIITSHYHYTRTHPRSAWFSSPTWNIIRNGARENTET